MRCKLVCNCNGFSQMCGPQGTLISPNRIRSGNGDCSAEALQYMRQALRSRIYEEAESRAKNLHHPLFGDIKNEVTDVRSLRAANLFAIAMASHRCVCCKAHLYLQIEYSQATWSALPRRYSICGKHCDAEYTKKPARCKLVCNSNGFSQMCVLQGTLISPNRMQSGNRDCSAEALQYMRQAKRSRIYEEA